MKLAIVNGPNNNFYGIRNKGQYGNQLYEDLMQELVAYGESLGFEVRYFQSNGEGPLIDYFQSLYLEAEEDGQEICMILNPGAFTHYSYALMDALESVHELVPAIECHMSNIHKRDEFRHKSVTACECLGQIAGFGKNSYKLAMHAFKLRMESQA